MTHTTTALQTGSEVAVLVSVFTAQRIFLSSSCALFIFQVHQWLPLSSRCVHFLRFDSFFHGWSVLRSQPALWSSCQYNSTADFYPQITFAHLKKKALHPAGSLFKMTRCTMPAFGSMSHLNHKLYIKDWCSQLWRHPLVFAHCKLKVQFYFHGHQLVSFAQPELAELDEGFSYLGYASIKAWLGLLQGSFVDPADVTYTSGWCHLRHCRLIMC